MKQVSEKSQEISVRYTRPDDKPKILSMLKETNFFRPQELLIAEEVLDDALAEGANGHYQSFAAEEDGTLVGWVCFGPTPCTVDTFDIYWLVVAPQKQRNGVGAYLMQYATNLIKSRNGRMIVAETSGHSRYQSTRRFYERMNYSPVSRVRDFYALGDDKVIYVKSI
jgi:ribosomal protein S18 acetylase RimI-like enzyme